MTSSANALLASGKQTPSHTDQAIVAIKQMILDNRLPAGSNHLETELASMLGMSRTPIREAALILKAQGLIDIRPRKGIHIIALSPQDMREIYQVLTELEGLAAELAAARALPLDAFVAADHAINDMDAALKQNNREAWSDADGRFHKELVMLSGHTRIIDSVEIYTNQAARARNVTLYMRPEPSKSNDDHRKVLEAIRAGYAKEARLLYTRHRRQAGELLLEIVEKYRLHLI